MRIPNVQDTAEVLSSLVKVLLELEMPHPRRTQKIQPFVLLLKETGNMLRMLQAHGSTRPVVDGSSVKGGENTKRVEHSPISHVAALVQFRSYWGFLYVTGAESEIKRGLAELVQYCKVRFLCWLYVIGVLLCAWDPTAQNNAWCCANVSSTVLSALYVSCLEIISALQGRSPSHPWYASLLPVVHNRSHYFVTLICWALGGITLNYVFLPLSAVLCISLWLFGHSWSSFSWVLKYQSRTATGKSVDDEVRIPFS